MGFKQRVGHEGELLVVNHVHGVLHFVLLDGVLELLHGFHFRIVKVVLGGCRVAHVVLVFCLGAVPSLV